MKILILVTLFSSLCLAQEENPLYQTRKRNQADKTTREAQLIEQEAKKVKVAADLERLKGIRDHWKENISSSLSEIDRSMKDMSFTARTLSKKAGFLRCVREQLEGPGYSDVQRCQNLHPGKFSAEDLALIAKWKSLHSTDYRSVVADIGIQERALTLQTDIIANTKRQIGYLDVTLSKVEQQIVVYEQREAEKAWVNGQPQYTNCDENTPTINLEEEKPFPEADFKGAFADIPRDNQDGLGTCFANTAKNMLVGLSKGEMNASFLDMALQYQTRDGNALAKSIGSGNSCDTLEAIEKFGYCPQAYSPTEMGEKNSVASGIFGKDVNSVIEQSNTIDAIGAFSKGKKVFDASTMDKSKMSSIKAIIDDLKQNPDVTLPLPVLRHDVVDSAKLNETFIWGVKIKPADLTLEKFKEEYQVAYAPFKPTYAKAVMEGKNLGQVFDLFKAHMKPFFDKYGMHDSVMSMKYNFEYNTSADFSSPNLAGRVKASLDFFRRHINYEGTDEELIKYCQDGDAGVTYLSEMQTLLNHLRARQIDVDNLFDERGELRNMKDIMQLAIAPSCLSPENRKKLDFGFTCEQSNPAAAMEKRKLILASLLKGLPIASTFAMYNGHHINTMVGMRFNKEMGRCEYLVRESQDGRSHWTSESEIFGKTMFFTEVRRK